MLNRLRKWLAPLEMTPLHPQWIVLRQREPLTSWVKQHAHGLVLDIGCGNGWLRKHFDAPVRYIGLDYPATIALGYTGSADVLADAAQLPISDFSCDTVLLLDVVEHLAQPERALKESFRVLRPGGICLIHIPFMYPLHDEPYDYQRLTLHGLEHLITKAGFHVATVEPSAGAIETAGALMSIALAKGVVDSLQSHRWSILLTPFVIAMIPFVNIATYILGTLFPKAAFMPFSYRLLAQKPK
jgi:SAM-dependent methyltransferase